MSEKATSDSSVVEVLRTVTPGYGSRENTEMNALGWGLFLGLLVILVPFLPFIAIAWVISKVLEKIGN
jgi:hypothetical protein